MISVVGKEGHHFHALGLCIVVANFGNWQELLPVILLIVAICSQVLLKGCVDTFGLSFCLGVKCHAEFS